MHTAYELQVGGGYNQAYGSRPQTTFKKQAERNRKKRYIIGTLLYVCQGWLGHALGAELPPLNLAAPSPAVAHHSPWPGQQWQDSVRGREVPRESVWQLPAWCALPTPQPRLHTAAVCRLGKSTAADRLAVRSATGL